MSSRIIKPRPAKAKSAARKPSPDDGFLAVAENRHPVTIALTQALRSGAGSARWKDEMVGLVRQAAQKFVGFGNTVAMRQALDINLGLLSFALVHRTRNKEDVEAWIRALQENALEVLVGEALQEIKAGLFSGGDLFFFEMGVGGTSREVMLAIARHRSPGIGKQPGKWNGYGYFLSAKASRQSDIDSDRLAQAMVEKVLGRSPEAWRQQVPEIDVMHADEVINSIVLAYCSIPAARRVGDILLNMETVTSLRETYEKAPKEWMRSFRERFENLLELLPADSRKVLAAKNWIEVHVKDGPPKVRKTHWKNGEPTSLTGIFLHSVYP